MVVRVTSAASIMALAVAAWPFPAHAQELSSPTPNLGCTNPGTLADVAPSTVNTINWGDGFSLGAPTVFVDSNPGLQFDCSGNMFSAPLNGSMFKVNFGTPGSIPGETLKFELNTPTYEELKLDFKYNVSEFDIYFLKINVDGILEGKDFIGLKIESKFGDSQVTNPANPLFIDANGNLILDPTIPNVSDTLELINTHGAPTPEPATFALFGTGLLAAARVLRRKSRR